jgi:pSer/pThr/pTyr-binding forkhead associated (FHA) protein
MSERIHGAVTQIGPSLAPKLEVTRGQNVGETYKVKLKTRLGRELDNDIVLTDPRISRYHAQISMEAGEWTLTDLGSSNLTYLNGMTIDEPKVIQVGARLG